MPRSLSGVALITGASSGIGQGTAIAFAEAGCKKMLLGDVNEQGLRKTKADVLGTYTDVDVDTIRVDVSDEASVQHFIDKCVERFGRVDYACNIAGICPPRTPTIDVDPEVFDKVVNVNLYGTFLCHRAEIRQMLRQQPLDGGIRGCIVSTSSMAGLNASGGASAYSSTKFGIIGLVKTDALDYGKHDIRVNAVCPGFTDTDAMRAISTADQRESIAATIPLKRLADAVDIGRTFAFLCSREANYIHGAAYPVDGGSLTYRQA